MFMENHNEVIAFIGHRLALSGVTKVVRERRDKGRKVQTKLARERGNNGREREFFKRSVDERESERERDRELR